MNKYRILHPFGFHDGTKTHPRGAEVELQPGPQLDAGLTLKMVEPVKAAPADPKKPAAAS